MDAAASSHAFATHAVPRTRLVGRGAELKTAGAFLLEQTVPLLTLTGPGGVGKTRLALAVGHASHGRFSHGTLVVDLAPLADSSLVAETIASGLDVVPIPERSIVESIVRRLHREQRLLILDNCEHVLITVANLVARLIEACPAVQVLATSRAPLAIRGEQILRIDPFPMPSFDPGLPLEMLERNEAISLFTERVRAVRSGFSLTNANAQVIVQICRALDGLPLAIELAAAHMRVLSPEMLLAQLCDHPRLLGDGPRDLPPRQRSLHDAIAWSYGLLLPADQRFLRCLAAFAGGWTLEAASSVGNLPVHEALLGLERLCDQSLMHVQDRDGEPRFTMLETIRSFALECLDESADAHEARGRHAAYFHELAAQAEPELELGRYSTGWLARLDKERDNVRAALTWRLEQGAAEGAMRMAGGMAEYWAFRGDFREGCFWCERAFALDETGMSEQARCGVLYGIAILESFRGHHSRAVTAAQQMLHLAERGSLPREQMRAHFAQSFSLRHQESFERALQHGHLAAKFGHVLDASGWVGWALTEIAQNPLCQDAELAGKEALHLFRELGSELGQVNALAILADQAAARHDTPLAARYYQESLALRQTIQDRWGMAKILLGIAALASECHRPKEAVQLLAAAVAWAGNVSYSMDYIITKKPRDLSTDLQGRLGSTAFEEAWDSGASMTSQDVIARAEALLTDLANDNVQKCSSVHPSPVNSGPFIAHSFQPKTASDTMRARRDFSLTRREREILALLCQRLTYAEIGDQLFISPRTVSRHVANLYLKIGVSTRRDATAFAAHHSLV